MVKSYPSGFIAFVYPLDLKLTSLRKEVLFILWQAQRPLKAYELLEKMSPTTPGIKPPSIYRALLYLSEKGIVHKVDSIQSYMLCAQPEKKRLSEILMVCNHCHAVLEKHDDALQVLVNKTVGQFGFMLESEVIELKGICEKCFNKSASL